MDEFNWWYFNFLSYGPRKIVSKIIQCWHGLAKWQTRIQSVIPTKSSSIYSVCKDRMYNLISTTEIQYFISLNISPIQCCLLILRSSQVQSSISQIKSNPKCAHVSISRLILVQVCYSLMNFIKKFLDKTNKLLKIQSLVNKSSECIK